MSSDLLTTRNIDFFNFDAMTWDAVAELPRDAPLVLPLGSGYDLNLLADQLGNPPRVGILPAIPFGWRGSGIEVPDAIMIQVIMNLLDSLRDDGFSRVYCLAPQGIDPQASNINSHSASFLRLPNVTAYSSVVHLPPDSEREKVILIPIGHTEQHGYHLPLSVDTIIIDTIAQDTATRVPTRSFSLPATPYGVSTHRASFAATLNVGGRAFEDFWGAVIDVLAARGFNRFYSYERTWREFLLFSKRCKVRRRTPSPNFLRNRFPAHLGRHRVGRAGEISNFADRRHGTCLRT